jgi:hypothetical protein
MIEAKHKELALLKYRENLSVFRQQNRLTELVYYSNTNELCMANKKLRVRH